MSFKFAPDVRQKAKDKGNYLIGIHITSPHKNKGGSFTYQTPAFSEAECDELMLLLVDIFNGKVSPKQLRSTE